MPVLTGTEIFHSNGQTETATETEYTTMFFYGSANAQPGML